MMIDLDEVVDKLEQYTECKGAILYGANGSFCSGGDLNVAKQMSDQKVGFAMATHMNHVLEKLKNLPIITVAFIEGPGSYAICLLYENYSTIFQFFNTPE